MDFYRRADGQSARIGILAGAFHPPTRAHLGLALAALSTVDEVLFVLPRKFPHKQYERVSFKQRLQLLLNATAEMPRSSVSASDGGLFIEIARECRQAYGPNTELWFLTGSDAAERIVNWDYGDPSAFASMLGEFGLLVATRGVAYKPPAEIQARIKHLPLAEDYSDVSSTKVRESIAAGGAWEHLVPPRIVEDVRRIYNATA